MQGRFVGFKFLAAVFAFMVVFVFAFMVVFVLAFMVAVSVQQNQFQFAVFKGDFHFHFTAIQNVHGEAIELLVAGD